MNELNINLKTLIIIVLNILLLFVIIYGLFYKKREGFNPAKEIKKMVKRIKKTEKAVGKIPEQMESMGKKIQKNTVDIFTNKLKSIFTQIGDMFNEGLIKPLTTLFTAIGNVFVQVFYILKKIGGKIASLPGCIIVYSIQSTIDTIFFIYRKIIPKFIRESLSFIYKYTFRYIFEFIGWVTGYTAAVKSCYGFNVSDEVDKISAGFNKAQKSFTQNFGNLNFSKIKV
jgi:DNA-binding ferritin-like protein (Dps family)